LTVKISQKPWMTAFIFIGVAAVAVVGGILVTRFARGPAVFRRVAQADRVVIYLFPHEREPRIIYTGVELSLIIEAVQNSRRDRGMYNTPVGVFVMDFYKGEVKVATMYTGSPLFRAGGKQYRDRGSTLLRLVDRALDAAVDRKAREEKEKGP